MKFRVSITESDDKVTDIVQAIIDCDEPFDVYGVRMDDRRFRVGDILPNSVVWLDGVRTTEELNGTCAMRIAYPEYKYVVQAVSNLGKTASKIVGCTPKPDRDYPNKHMYLISGESGIGGADPGEVIIKHAKVIKIIK